MRLLVITQRVDLNDPDLGFFHTWLEKLAVQVDQLLVICLAKGQYDLPANVTVFSLGKERQASRFTYLWRFFSTIWLGRGSYDGVLVHMNPEYVVLGGLMWRFWGKPVLLWYTHKAVNFRLFLAEKLANKIFTASRESFRLSSLKKTIVGHGIDADFFSQPTGFLPLAGDTWLLWVGRISPTKDLETVIKSCAELRQSGFNFYKFTILGQPITPADNEYKKVLASLVAKLNLEDSIGFRHWRPYLAMPGVYRRHHLFIHTSKTGSIDKVVLEALASGLYVLSSSEAFRAAARENIGITSFEEGNARDLADKIEKLYRSGILGQPNRRGREWVAKHHNLDRLVGTIIDYFSRGG